MTHLDERVRERMIFRGYQIATFIRWNYFSSLLLKRYVKCLLAFFALQQKKTQAETTSSCSLEWILEFIERLIQPSNAGTKNSLIPWKPAHWHKKNFDREALIDRNKWFVIKKEIERGKRTLRLSRVCVNRFTKEIVGGDKWRLWIWWQNSWLKEILMQILVNHQKQH